MDMFERIGKLEKLIENDWERMDDGTFAVGQCMLVGDRMYLWLDAVDKIFGEAIDEVMEQRGDAKSKIAIKEVLKQWKLLRAEFTLEKLYDGEQN